MPCHRSTPLLSAGDLLVMRVHCDGRDAARVEEERIEGDRVVVPLQGRFAFRDRSTSAVVSPAKALFLRCGQAFEIRHPSGEGDVSLSIRGRLARQLVAAGPTTRDLAASGYARLQGGLRGLAGGASDPLAAEEALCASLAPVERRRPFASRRDRALADAIAADVELCFDANLPLSDLATRAGVSVFHACRVFRSVMGTSIHRHRQEIRLRHALALLLDTRLPLAQVASQCGFANQGHLGNSFRRRFGVSPGRARGRGLLPA